MVNSKAKADEVRPLTIMCIGDSITVGSGANGGYRLPLEKMFEGAGIPMQFVGRLHSNSQGMAWPNHEGYSGCRIEEIQNGVTHHGKFEFGPISEGLTALKPDVVLLLCGTNDARQNNNIGGAGGRIDHFIAGIEAADPGARILVGTIPPLVYNDDGVRRLNADAAAAVAKRAAAGEKVSLVDHYSTLNSVTDIISDRTHPNVAGYDKMARNWFNALEPHAPQVGFGLSTEGSSAQTDKGSSGYQITMKRDAVVTDLGIYGGGQALTTTRAAGIFDITGKELGRVQITPELASSGLFVYKALAIPVTLKAGQSYIFASNNSGFPVLSTTDAVPDPLYVENPRFYFDHGVGVDMDPNSHDGNLLKFPGTNLRDQNSGVGYFGPIFRLAPP